MFSSGELKANFQEHCHAQWCLESFGFLNDVLELETLEQRDGAMQPGVEAVMRRIYN